ncbi:MAG TPA: hypothetical protein VN174_02505 [Candidatus Methanoperedens sp.]|nr:hypothetical protein [Candidatus Methanoperedens sp.]
MIKTNREKLFSSILNNLSQLLNPPKEVIQRGHCSTIINNTQHISSPEIRTDIENQKKYCVCPHHRDSGKCLLSKDVIANAKQSLY